MMEEPKAKVSVINWQYGLWWGLVCRSDVRKKMALAIELAIFM
jgi:hypothetical protein